MIKSIFNIPGDRRKDENGELVGIEEFELPVIEIPMRLVVGDWVNLESMYDFNQGYEGILTEHQKDLLYNLECPEIWIAELKVVNNEYVMYYMLRAMN